MSSAKLPWCETVLFAETTRKISFIGEPTSMRYLAYRQLAVK